MTPVLARVKRATKARERAEVAWHEAIRQAHADGSSLRTIADHAGVSHVWVFKIVRSEFPIHSV